MKLGSYTTYEYNNRGNIIREYEYSTQDELRSTRYNKYDEHNRLAEYYDKRENVDSEYSYSTKCEYDINDNIIKTIEYRVPIEKTDLYGYSEYEYEDNKLMVVKNYIYIYEEDKGVLTWYYENEYDDEGRVNKRCFYNDIGELTSYIVIEYK